MDDVDVASELQAYYARDEEHDRLTTGSGLVEFARTVEVLGRTLPAAPALVADIGGGPGCYTDWLVEHGYTVVHRDLVDLHVEQVRRRYGPAVDTAVADARALDLETDSVDALLLLGPLYHLVRLEERIAALAESRRVVRPGGTIYAAAIGRWTPRLDGIVLKRVHELYPQVTSMVDELEATGRIKPLHDRGFTGYAHTPAQLRHEVELAGLEVEALVGLEGISFALADIDERMHDPAQRGVLLDMLRATETVPDLLGVSPHLLVAARRVDGQAFSKTSRTSISPVSPTVAGPPDGLSML